MLPNFVVPGFERSGTTWLYDVLKGHPDIYLPSRKEIYFFDKYYRKGVKWYEGFYKNYSGQRWVGDISPSYVRDPESVKRMYKLLPNAKIIIALRHPASMLYSTYLKLSREKNLKCTFYEYTNEQLLRNRFSYEMIKRCYDYYSDDNILILFYEDLAKQPTYQIEKTLKFLCLEADEFISKSFSTISLKRSPTVEPTSNLIYSTFWRIYQALGEINTRLFKNRVEALNSTLSRLRNVIKKGLLRPAIAREFSLLEADRIRIEQFYHEDVSSLSGLIGIDLFDYWDFRK